MRTTILFCALALGATSSSVLAQTATLHPLTTSSDVAPAAPAGGSGYQINNYQWDDGTTENSLGWTNGGTFCFIHRFDVAGGGQDTITKVLASFGSPTGASNVAVGSQVRVFVWDDPNDDGNPYDCVLISSATGVTLTPNTDTFETFAVPPAIVTNRFYVGVDIDSPVGTFPGSMDTTVVNPDVAWLSGSLTPGGYTGVPINGSHNLLKASSNPWACNWLLRAEGGSSDITYCVAKSNALGCVPAIGSLGVASATATSGHPVRSINNRNNKNGLLFYGVNGQANTPYQGGTLCVKTPIKRTPSTNSGGTPAPANDCTGVYSLDMNAFAQGLIPGGTPLAALTVPGTVVDCQWWGRDPGFPAPNNTSLSDGLEYVVGP